MNQEYKKWAANNGGSSDILSAWQAAWSACLNKVDSEMEGIECSNALRDHIQLNCQPDARLTLLLDEQSEAIECFRWLCQNGINQIEQDNVLSYEIRFALPSGNAFYDIKAAMEKEK